MDMACEVGTEVLYTRVILWTNTSSAYTENITDDIMKTGKYEPIFSPENMSHDDKTARSSDTKSGS
jgi:hypothetical protein